MPQGVVHLVPPNGQSYDEELMQTATLGRSGSMPVPAQWTDNAEQELRCNLGMVLGFTELLATDGYEDLNPRQRAWVDHIVTQGHRLQELINSSLVLARVERSGLTRPTSSERLANLMRHVVKGEEFEAQARSVKIDARYELCEPTGRVLVEPQLFSSVLRSSLNCFVQALKPGSELRVRVTETESGFDITYDADPTTIASAKPLSPLMRASWDCIFGMHGATLEVDEEPLQVRMHVPKQA